MGETILTEQILRTRFPLEIAQVRLLRLLLGFAAFAWGVSVFGIFFSWSAAEQALIGLVGRPQGQPLK